MLGKINKIKYFLPLLWGLAYAATASAAVLVREDDFAGAVKEEFANQGIDDDIDLEFFGGQTNFSVKEASSFKIMVSDLKYDEQQDKFSCRAEVFADGNRYAVTDINGKFYRLAGIYVPARDMKKGETIKEDDLKNIKIRRNRIKNAHLTEKEKIVGKETKRMLKEGKLILENDVGEKVIVRKGDVVTALYATPHMQITAKAQALSDGAKGEKIELLNLKSKKNLYGEVLDAETVKIDVR